MVAARDSILCDSFSRLRHLGGELVSVIPVAYGFLETGIGWDRPVHKMPGFREYMIDVRFHDVLGLFARAGRRIPDSLPSLYAGNILTTQHLSSPDADLPPTRFSRLEYWPAHIYVEPNPSHGSTNEPGIEYFNHFSVESL